MERLLRSLLERLAPRWSPVMFKATLVAAVAAALVIPLALVATPFIEFFNGMAAQPKGKAQMTYGRRDGQALLVTRDPVEGTVPRGYHPYPFDHLDTKIETAKAVGEVLDNPVPITEEALLSGKERYEVFCIVCHGATGQGDGLAVGVNPATGVKRFPVPPSFHTEQARGYSDGTVYHIVTKGLGKMPSYADKLSPEERLALSKDDL